MSVKTRIAAIAGLAALNGTIAFAADMTADVPFTFTTPAGGHIPSGKVTFSVVTESPSKIFKVTHPDTRTRVLVATRQTILRSGEGTLPASVLFSCADGRCSLAGIYTPGNDRGWFVYVPREKESAATQITMIRIPLTSD